ncbi:nitroreductase family protein [Methanobacterium alcaliphilum]|uniref:nitroreductase family protein n=1 Tax=Methanobacterium alcaliphilum TaxID=392018 RepID=UPI0024A894C6|nr:nitroreductase family protein [Methanobacterium alcaliphilum]
MLARHSHIKKRSFRKLKSKIYHFNVIWKPQRNLHRSNISEFKRKSLHEITDIKGLDDILEAARIAPSATNAQPWFFKGNNNIIHTYTIKPNFVKGLFTKKYPPIDVGIALYHLKLVAEHLGKKTELLFDPPHYNDREEHNYIGSLKLK